MDLDPLTKDVAPPRHEIESDSEDEAEEGSLGRKRSAFTPPKVQVSLDTPTKGKRLTIFQGEGGEAFVRARVQQETEAGKVMLDGEQVR